jgi:hypothetical protein
VVDAGSDLTRGDIDTLTVDTPEFHEYFGALTGPGDRLPLVS